MKKRVAITRPLLAALELNMGKPIRVGRDGEFLPDEMDRICAHVQAQQRTNGWQLRDGWKLHAWGDIINLTLHVGVCDPRGKLHDGNVPEAWERIR